MTEVLRPDLSEEELTEASRNLSNPKKLSDFKEVTERQHDLLRKRKINLQTKLENPHMEESKREDILTKLNDVKGMKNLRFEHENSLIPSHAFYSICDYLNCPSYQLAKIWLDAIKNVTSDRTDFRGFAKQTVIEAARFFWKDNKGQLQDVADAVRNGWNKVGIGY